jgi:hypothetical protein
MLLNSEIVDSRRYPKPPGTASSADLQISSGRDSISCTRHESNPGVERKREDAAPLPFAQKGSPEPFTIFFVPITKWSDGTPSTKEAH